MFKQTLTPRFFFITAMILVAAFSRLLPHPFNFTAIGAMALFGGACFRNRVTAMLVPLAALLLSDVVMELSGGTGFYRGMPVVYACFILYVFLGFCLRSRRRIMPIACASVVGSAQFFIITNFEVWLNSDFYPRTWAGLIECYGLAIPFYQNTFMMNTFLGDLTYSAVLFGGLALAELAFPLLRQRVPNPSAKPLAA